MLVAPSPSNMPAWYSLQLDPWSSALSTATELSNDSVAQLVRPWQAICQVMGLSSPWVIVIFFSLSFVYFSPFAYNGFDQVQVWLSALEHVNNWTSRFVFVAPSPSNMPAWYPLWLVPWQLGLYSNSATELPNDSVAQLVRAWQAIYQVMGLFHFSLFLSFLYFSPFSTLTRLRSDCQVWSMLITEPAPHASCSPHPPSPLPPPLYPVHLYVIPW